MAVGVRWRWPALRVDDAALVARDHARDGGAVFAQGDHRGHFIVAREARVTDHVAAQDGGEFAFRLFVRHGHLPFTPGAPPKLYRQGIILAAIDGLDGAGTGTRAVLRGQMHRIMDQIRPVRRGV